MTTIIHIPITVLVLIAFACMCIGASLGALLLGLAQAGKRAPLQFEQPKPIQPRAVVRHWDVDGEVQER